MLTNTSKSLDLEKLELEVQREKAEDQEEESLMDGSWSEEEEIYVSDSPEEEDILDKEAVTDTETPNGDSSDTQEDISFKIDLDMSWIFMPGKDTMEPIFMPGIERTVITKDGNF